jgi:acyl-CoA synthetase (AMP-forming)/AMP-acid ligase II
MTPNTALAHVDGPSLTGLDEMIWLATLPRLGAARFPDRIAILFAERNVQVTYLQLDRQSDAFARLLHTRGLQPGDRVAYFGRNSDLFFPVLFGSIRAGIVLVPLNWRLATPEIAYQLKDSGARLLLCDPEFAAALGAALHGFDSPPEILNTEGDDVYCLRALLSQPAAQSVLRRERDQIILQLYTSGTTGKAKGVLVSHYALSVARHCELVSPEFSNMTEGSTSLSAMPNFHIGGMSWVLIGLVRFGTVVLTADPSPKNMLNLIRKNRVEHCFMVPTVIRTIAEELTLAGQPAPNMKSIYYGAMKMSTSLLREVMSLFDCSFSQFFGMTEISGSATLLGPADHDLGRPHLLASVGKPYPGFSIEIRDSTRSLLTVGQHGEIWISSPTVFSGYWHLPDKTRKSIVDGWYATGDGGYVDEEGYLYLTDRISDMIVSGGENIYPVEVEDVLRAHPAILDVACVGVEDRTWGEIVVAVAELRSQHSTSEDELRKFARESIAAFKCPKRIHFIAELPRTASGKVKRAELRAQIGKLLLK